MRRIVNSRTLSQSKGPHAPLLMRAPESGHLDAGTAMPEALECGAALGGPRRMPKLAVAGLGCLALSMFALSGCNEGDMDEGQELALSSRVDDELTGIQELEENGETLGQLKLEAQGNMVSVANFGTNPGNLSMYYYSPPGIAAGAPIVVAMHGCTQDAATYKDTGWNELADLWKFHVVYPEQKSGNNSAKCFNWGGEYGDPANLVRGKGENESVRQMVDYMVNTAGINGDAGRVYIQGFSAGAAFTSVMLATWPDIFDAGVTHAGIPYYCATTVNDSYKCMSPGKNKTPQQWGDLVRTNGFPAGYTGPYPRVSIWQGDADTTVVPMNQQELIDQWTNVNGIDAVEDLTTNITSTGGTHVYKAFKNSTGSVLVESYTIAGMAHGVALDSNYSTEYGCGRIGGYFKEEDICSTILNAKFFGLDQGTTPTNAAPTVSITSPSNGATVSGSVTISASASDDVGVSRVDFVVDGTVLGSDTSAPYSSTWNAASAAAGTHQLSAIAYDAAGLSATASVSVSIASTSTDTTAPSVNITTPTTGSTVTGAVTINASASDNVGVVAVEFYANGALISRDTASPWSATWSTGALAAGSYALSAKAFDAAGNTALDNDTTVTIAAASVSDFSEAFTGTSPDNTGWTLTNWSLVAVDHTGNSGKSLYSAAQSKFNTVSNTASIKVKLGAAPVLSYYRRLSLYSANTVAAATFKVTINGTSVDVKTVTALKSYSESSWTQRAAINLSAYANQEVTLAVVAEVTDTASTVSYAKAWIDDIFIDNTP